MDTEGQMVRQILRQNEFLLRRHLVLSKTVLEQLKANGLITEIARRKILLEPVHKQIGVLIRTMEYKGLNSLKKFMDVLKQTGHSFLVDNILDTDVSVARLQANTADGLNYRDDARERTFTLGSTGTGNSTGPQGLEYRRAIRKSCEPSSLMQGVRSYLGDDVDRDRGGLSLASLLRARQPKEADPTLLPRGHINTRTLLTDPTVTQQPLYPELSALHQAQYAQGAQVNPNAMMFPRGKEDIPSTLYGLNQAFSDQDQKNQHALNVLRQEEMAIRQLMEQNARDQSQVRRKQQVVTDIVHRLQDIHVRANEVYKPGPHPNVGRYRLSQLNQIPWSIDR